MCTFKCPKGHDVHWDASETTCPVCDVCRIVATHYNPREGVVYSWTPIQEYRRNCERLQDAMDEAFDNQYFNEGW